MKGSLGSGLENMSIDTFLTQILALSIVHGRDIPTWANIDYLTFEMECGMTAEQVYLTVVYGRF